MNRLPMKSVLAVACGVVLLGGPSACGVMHDWTRQFGTPEFDSGNGVSADGLGNVYLSGFVDDDDAFLNKYDAAGNLQWTRQLGTGSFDSGDSVSADGLGNVYLSGFTGGSLGGPNAGPGSDDAFVSKYDAAGNLLWIRQFGTANSDVSSGVSADGLGNVYSTGYTFGNLGGPNAGNRDAFVTKYDAAGNRLWARQLGTSSFEWGKSISADGLGNVYLAGITEGSLGGPSAGRIDTFVSKYDAVGNLLWTRLLGTSSDDYGSGVSADGLGNVYITGTTRGSLGGPSAGGDDAFLGKYDAVGNLLWTRQLGSAVGDVSSGVSADSLGGVYIAGFTFGSLGGPFAGGSDAFVSKYDASGELVWIEQLGPTIADNGYAVSADGLGQVYISGRGFDTSTGPNAETFEAFVAKFSETAVPEPSFAAMLIAVVITTVARSARRDNRLAVQPFETRSV